MVSASATWLSAKGVPRGRRCSQAYALHTVGKVPAGTGSPKMAFEEASRLLNPSWRDGSTPVAPLSTALVQRA